MLRRNFVASLAALFAARKLPKVEKVDPFQTDINKFYTLSKEARKDYYYHNQFKSWIKIKAAEPINVGGLVYIDNNGMAREAPHKYLHNGHIGVCMVNNWPEDVVVALYD